MQNPNAGQFYPLGLFPHGDWGPWTIYTNRNRRVVKFNRAPPKEPPSYAQERNRLAWRATAAAWSALPEAEKQWWRAVARQNHLTITAYNLYVHCSTTYDPTCLDALKKP